MNSQEFIKKYRKRLESGPDFFNPDTCLMTMEQYEKAKCRILLCFPTPHANKTVSSTAAAINDFVIEHCPDTFVDFAYMVEGKDIDLYDQNNMPYAIGNVTHLDASHFDLVGFSISVLSDIVSAPVMLKSFERCDKPITLWWSDRKDLPLGEQPIIFMGGITAAYSDVCFGKVGDKEAFMDFLYLGACDKLDLLCKRLIEAKETGKITRSQSDHDVLGIEHTDIPDLQETVEVKTIQDYINAQFDCRWCYQPQAYEVKFNKSRQIISNKRINKLAQDWVQPYYPHILPPDLGIGRTILNANGDMAGTSQTQVSEGAMLKGTLIRTEKGFVRVEDLCQSEIGHTDISGVVDTTSGPAKLYHQFNQGVKDIKLITLESGRVIGLTPEHPVEQFYIGDTETHFVEAGKLNVGDYLISTPSMVWPKSCPFNEYEAEFIGRMLGDGQYNLYSSKTYSKTHDHKMYLCCSWTDVEYCETLMNNANIKYTKDEGNYGYCKFWIESKDKLGRSMLDFWGFNQFYKTLSDNTMSGKYIPSTVYSFTKECMKAFIKGYYDTDGHTVTKNGVSRVSFESEFEYILDDIQQFLFALGIPSTKSYCKSARVKYVDANVVPKFVDCTCLNINSAYFDKFNDFGIAKKAVYKTSASRERLPINGLKELIKSRSTSKKGLLTALNNKFLTKRRAVIENIWFPDYYFDKIVSITDSVGQVYDLSVENVEKLLANGVSVHNCSASGACSFCAEGNYCSGWVEKSKDQILWEIREAKKYNAGYKYKPYSFNSNYLTDYKGMLKEFMQVYPKVSFINMRMEELGRDVDAIRMMKLIGANRIAAPLEGFSPRIQNNLLNKCLSTESLRNFMEDMVHAKMVDIKVGAIYTGYEEDEDFQWIYDFVGEIKEKAQIEGGNFPIRINCTPLVHYPLTPIEYLERKTAWRSYKEMRWFTDEWYNKYRDVNMRVKMHGFRWSTFVEQSIVDLGRALTPLIYKHFVSTLTPIYTLRSIVTKGEEDENGRLINGPGFVDDLKEFIDPNVHFADRDPEHYISPCHRIHIELLGSYVPRARRLIRHKRNGNIFDNEPDIRCLKTYDGAKTVCQKNCIFNDPLHIYADVEMDEQGNLHGESRPLVGCERCKTNEERKNRLAREIIQSANSDDIIATPRIPQVQKIRFILYRNPEYDLLSPNNTSHSFVTKFLQKSDTLLDSYHSVISHNMFWQSEPCYKYCTSGYQIVDTMWSKNVIKEVQALIPEVNESLTACKVVSATDILRDEKLDVNDYNIFYFESSLPQEYFNTAKIHYNGEIKVDGGTGASIELKTTIAPELKACAPIFASKGKVCGTFALPLKYNPVNFLSSFVSAAKKTSFEAILESTTIECMMTVRNNLAACKNCGKENATISISTGKPIAYGVSCLCKALLTKKIKG